MKNQQPHILFLPRWYPHFFDPMFGLFVKKHAEAVALYKQVTVLYVQPVEKGKRFERKQIVDATNLFTLIYYYKQSSCRMWNALRFWYFLLKGYFFIKAHYGKPEIIHVHVLTRLGVFAYLLKKIYRIPYVITEHWSRYLPNTNVYKGRIRKRLTKRVVKNAKAILPVSKMLEEAMQSHGLINPNYRVIPNVIEDVFFQDFQSPKENKPTVFLHVSTFDDSTKNISGIIRAIKQLVDFNLDFRFWFVGDGVDLEALKNYANTLSIPERIIRFYGVLDGQDLANKYQQADFLVSFSNFETFLVVFYEAQACGLPVVTTNVGGLDKQINETNGFLIEPGNETQLIDTLKMLILNPPVFDKKLIRGESEKKYSYQTIGKRLIDIYQSS